MFCSFINKPFARKSKVFINCFFFFQFSHMNSMIRYDFKNEGTRLFLAIELSKLINQNDSLGTNFQNKVSASQVE